MRVGAAAPGEVFSLADGSGMASLGSRNFFGRADKRFLGRGSRESRESPSTSIASSASGSTCLDGAALLRGVNDWSSILPRPTNFENGSSSSFVAPA